jgi:hypothetical protein
MLEVSNYSPPWIILYVFRLSRGLEASLDHDTSCLSKKSQLQDAQLRSLPVLTRPFRLCQLCQS